MSRNDMLLYGAGAVLAASLVWGVFVLTELPERADSPVAAAVSVTGNNNVSVTGSGNQVISGDRVVAVDGHVEIEGQAVPPDAKEFVTTSGHRYAISRPHGGLVVTKIR